MLCVRFFESEDRIGESGGIVEQQWHSQPQHAPGTEMDARYWRTPLVDGASESGMGSGVDMVAFLLQKRSNDDAVERVTCWLASAVSSPLGDRFSSPGCASLPGEISTAKGDLDMTLQQCIC